MPAYKFNYDGFKVYLKTTYCKNPETAKAHASDVRLFLTTVGSDENDSLNLLSLPMLESFRLTMEDEFEYKPSTIKEKLRRLLLAVKYIIRSIDNQDLYYKGKRIIDELEEWCHGLGKGISLQRKERAINVRQQMHKIQDPNEFLEHSTVCSLLHTITSNNNLPLVGESKTGTSL